MTAEPIHHPPEWPVYSEGAVEAVTRLARAGRSFDYSRGPELEGLEQSIAELTGRPYCLAVNSGTSALYAAYFALGLGPGDEVLVPSLTFLATVTPLLLLGVIPVLCDSGDANGNVTAATLEARITPRTRAICVTHLWGHPVDMDPVQRLASRHGLALVEDCSHAHGSRYSGRPVGSFGTVAVLSVGGVKTVSGGMGGALVTGDRRVYELACLLTSFRQRSRTSVRTPDLQPYVETGLGGNLRISPLACVLARSHLDDLDRLIAVKAGNIARLYAGIDGCPGLTPLATAPGCDPGGRYGVHLALSGPLEGRRDELVSALQAAGLKVVAPTTRPLHHEPLFSQGPPAGWALHPDVDWRAALRRDPFAPDLATELWDTWVALPATYLHDTEGSIVEPYVMRIRAVADALSEKAGSHVVSH
jgi:dTDP-4-amino-4,6-dideoxygalactose transaminase